jgi:tetratricopeptide (TPR) repeat protein
VLATRRELPAPLRAVLLVVACAGLQLALIVQSRGWLFTLPVIALVVIGVVPGRLRVLAASVIPVAAALIPLRRLLDVYGISAGAALDRAAARAGHAALLICAAMLVAGALIAWADTRLGPVAMGKSARGMLGTGLAVLALAGIGVGGVVATHGHPLGFVKKQLNGAVHQQVNFSSGSHFADVGSGRYDFWRTAWHGFVANPIGGLGQDNFADYYVTHRQTAEEPSWTHSLEMRLLVHTGIVGFALFAAFLAAAITAALRVRRRPDAASSALARAVAAAALIPLAVWLIHGSVDWFWEMPALSGPALGFLAIAGAIRRPATREVVAEPARRRIPRVLVVSAGAAALLAAVIAIGLPYLSVRDASIASDLRASHPAAALRALTAAAKINPLSAEPARLAGTIALQTGRYGEAEQRFDQAIAREPGGWFAWLGAGLAASALGNSSGAQHDFMVAASINKVQPAVSDALARVRTARPLRAAQALPLLVLAH